MTIIFWSVIYFQNMFVVSLIDFVVITKCYNSYLGYLTKISHLLQAFFFICCVLLIGGIEFLLQDSLLHVPFFLLQIKNVRKRSFAVFISVKCHHLLSLTRSPAVTNKELPHLFSIVQIRVVHSSWQSTYYQSTYCYVRHILCYSK